eukprot:6178228-Pleurochrysis_carterae.AAC.2
MITSRSSAPCPGGSHPWQRHWRHHRVPEQPPTRYRTLQPQHPPPSPPRTTPAQQIAAAPVSLSPAEKLCRFCFPSLGLQYPESEKKLRLDRSRSRVLPRKLLLDAFPY